MKFKAGYKDEKGLHGWHFLGRKEYIQHYKDGMCHKEDGPSFIYNGENGVYIAFEYNRKELAKYRITKEKAKKVGLIT